MSWLTKVEPLFLYQESDIPYVLLKNGVFLCFSNLYSTDKIASTEYSIGFSYNKFNVAKQSAGYVKIKTFPKLIPLSDVSFVNGISDYKAYKTSKIVVTDLEEKKISIIRAGFINRLSRDDIYDLVDNFDKTFVLSGENVLSCIRNLDDNVSTICHKNSDWGRTCVHIADHMSSSGDRQSPWTETVPPLDISCFGLRETEYLDKINSIFSEIGIQVSTKWEI